MREDARAPPWAVPEPVSSVLAVDMISEIILDRARLFSICLLILFHTWGPDRDGDPDGAGAVLAGLGSVP